MFMIMSAEVNDCTPSENRARTRDLLDDLYVTPYAYRRVEGSWEGILEEGFQVFKPKGCSEADWLDDLTTIAFDHFDQDAVLVVEETTRKATLHFRNGDVVAAGLWTLIDSPVGSDGWTRINGEYFLAA